MSYLLANWTNRIFHDTKIYSRYFVFRHPGWVFCVPAFGCKWNCTNIWNWMLISPHRHRTYWLAPVPSYWSLARWHVSALSKDNHRSCTRFVFLVKIQTLTISPTFYCVIYPQYGGFLGFILIIELAVATSIYAYKDRLADGFDRGLTESMKQYGSYENKKTTDFDIMQATVSLVSIGAYIQTTTICFCSTNNINTIHAWNILQLKCCGNHGYEDWYNPPVSMPVPKSCCRIPNCDTQDEAEIYTEVSYRLANPNNPKAKR